FISEQIDRARLVSREESLQEHTRETRSDSVPLVIQPFVTFRKYFTTNNLFLTPLPTVENSSKKHPWYLTGALPTFEIYSSERNLKALTNAVSCHPAPSALTQIMDASLAPTSNRDSKTTYTFSSTNEVRQIKHQITCNSTNLV
ncbi:hypothetical protein ACROYT_G028628, partial [Oculina patagonica]